jgi:hypothetical protein
VQKLCAPENRTILRFKSVVPDEFFATVLEKRPAIFETLGSFTDVGGLFRDYSNRFIAKSFLEFSKKHGLGFDGMLIFDDENTEGQASKLLLIEQTTYETFVLEGNDVVQALRNKGKDWKKLKLLTYFDIEHVIGANVKQKKRATTLFMLGEGLVFGLIFQAALRQREVLKGQTIVYCLLDSLASSIEETTGFELAPEAILTWSILNESQEDRTEVLSHAYEELECLVQLPAIEAMKGAVGSPSKQAAIFKKQAGAFILPARKDHYKLHEQASKKLPTATVLMSYAKQRYEAAHYDTPFSEEIAIYPAIKKVIASLSQLLKEIEAKETEKLTKISQMFCLQERLVEKSQLQKTFSDLRALPEREPTLSPYQHNLCSMLQASSTTLRALFDSPSFSEHVYYTKAAIETAMSQMTVLHEKFLKPIIYLLVIKQQEKLYTFALSDTEALHMQKLLQQPHLVPVERLEHKLALITTTGDQAHVAPSPVAFSAKEWQKVCKSQQFQDMLIDISLVHGRIMYLDRLVERMKTWHGFETVWQKVLQRAANPEAIKGEVMGRLIASVRGMKQSSTQNPSPNKAPPATPKSLLMRLIDII